MPLIALLRLIAILILLVTALRPTHATRADLCTACPPFEHPSLLLHR